MYQETLRTVIFWSSIASVLSGVAFVSYLEVYSWFTKHVLKYDMGWTRRTFPVLVSMWTMLFSFFILVISCVLKIAVY